MTAAIKNLDTSANVAPAAPHLLGRGRSGEVFLVTERRGPVALKVFGSGGLTKVVQRLLLGAPNPYQWNADAIRCAELRRRILAPLVQHWFGRRLRVARAYGHRFDEDRRSFELATEYCPGRAPRLHHPLARHRGEMGPNEARLLELDILAPLRAHLADAGFDGLLWQAGLGNPVALNNFLIEQRDDLREPTVTWIDLESGVPALFPASPKALFRFYLPRSLRLRRPLFDDVDVPRLRRYLFRASSLRAKMGASATALLWRDVDALEQAQSAWKGQTRTARSIGYHLASGHIDEAQASHYAARPVRWHGRELAAGIRLLPRALWAMFITLVSWTWSLARSLFVGAWRLAASSEARVVLAQRHVGSRIASWRARGQLEAEHAARLEAMVENRDASTHLADFGVHLAIKPTIKLAQFVVSPLLLLSGVIDEITLGLIWAGGGVAGRTATTSARIVSNTLRDKKRPWMALVVGLLPVVGTFAFLAQMAHDSRSRSALGARFVLVDAITRLGEHFPIWGGRDTATEHAFNRLGAALFAASPAPRPLPLPHRTLPEGPSC